MKTADRVRSLIRLINECGVNCASLARELGVHRSTVHRWREGDMGPNADRTFELMEIASRVAENGKRVATSQHQPWYRGS